MVSAFSYLKEIVFVSGYSAHDNPTDRHQSNRANYNHKPSTTFGGEHNLPFGTFFHILNH